MAVHGVVFDLDGTLLDTLSDLADAGNAALARLGHPVHPVDAYRTFVGDGMRTLVTRLLPDARRDEADIEAALQLMREEYSARWDAKTRPYDGVPEMLTALQDCGMLLGIVSNKPHDFTQLCVKRLLPRWSFLAVIGTRDGVPVKPDPTGALQVAAALGVAPADCLYVGDTDTDMKTGNHAGMPTVGAVWGFRTAEELRRSGAAHLAETPTELVSLARPS
jgi:phosphoglycolate phosphatase